MGTSLWFSINGVWLSYAQAFNLADSHLGYLTLAVQVGFISGTLLLAVTGLADRFKASQIFAVACFLGAVINILMTQSSGLLFYDVMIRLMTGICLAGIYPLGMKLVISWVPKYAGAALSWLVGMLTIGTSLPHLLRGVSLDMSWQWPVIIVSLCAVIGGLLILLLGTGSHLPPSQGKLRLGKGFIALKQPNFRAVAGGYFGHCWELYAFWMLVPLLVTREFSRAEIPSEWISGFSFFVIAIGAVGCVFGGALSKTIGSFNVARLSLLMSGSICFIYPLLSGLNAFILLVLLIAWGITVVADSPQFSALAAINAPSSSVGSSLAMMNAIGFALTLPSIWITSILWNESSVWVVLWLLPGPMIGLWALQGLRKTEFSQ